MKCENGLTDKQKLFADEYLIDLNATRAYKAVYKTCKKDETARVNGSKLLTNTNVSNYISERMKEREKRTEITQDSVLKELAKIGYADIKNYLKYKTAKSVVGHDDDGTPILDYRIIIDMLDSDDVDTSAIQEVSLSKDGTFKFKLYDKQKSLELIGKHLGMFEKQEDDTKTINLIHQIPRPTKEGDES